MSFDNLLKLVPVKSLRRALSRLCSFLENDAEFEDEYPDIPGCLEEILERLVKDVNVLDTPNIARCEFYSTKIIKMVKTNLRDQYYMLESYYKEVPDKSRRGLHMERRNKRVLVIRKVYFTDDLMIDSNNEHSKHSNNAQPNSPEMSRSASMATMISRSSLATLSSDEFINDCLKYILDFVKDDTQLNLEFHGLESKKARFLYILFRSVIASNYNNGLGGKHFCIALWEAVEIFSLKYKFGIRYNVSSSGVKESLVLEKKPKMSEREDADFPGSVHIQREKKKVAKYRDFISKLSHSFIIDHLKKFIRFLSDETEASINFYTRDSYEMRFLRNILNFSRSDVIKSAFNDEARELLDRIMVLDGKKVGYKLKIREKKPKSCGETEVAYIKAPKYDDSPESPRTRPSSMADSDGFKPKSNTRSSMADNVGFKPKSDNRGSTADSVGVKPKSADERSSTADSVGFKPKSADTRSSLSDRLLSRLKPNDKSLTVDIFALKSEAMAIRRAIKPSLNFQPGGILNQAKEHDSGYFSVPDPIVAMEKYKIDLDLIQPGNRNRETKYRLRRIQKPTISLLQKEQLLEALSVPVKSDKAMKIMVGMGWAGGALGSRGDGIVEPLMPNLQSVAGAGLGHTNASVPAVTLPAVTLPNRSSPVHTVHIPAGLTPYTPPIPSAYVPAPIPYTPPAQRPASPTPCESESKRAQDKFRYLFLLHLLDLLESQDESNLVQFHPPLNKREKGFLKHAMKTFAIRGQILLDGEAKLVWQSVEEQYAKDPHLFVTVCVSDDNKQIVLTKLRTETNLLEKKTPQEMSIALNKVLIEKAQSLVDNCATISQTNKAFEAMKFKVKILLKVLEFVKNDADKEMQMEFDVMLNLTQKNFIETSIVCAYKSQQTAVSGPEVALHREIRRQMGMAYRMTVVFGHDDRSFTAGKKYAIKAPCPIQSVAVADIETVPEYDNIDQIINNNEHSTENNNKTDFKIDELAENNNKIDFKIDKIAENNNNAIGKVEDVNPDDKIIENINILTDNDEVMTDSDINITVESKDPSVYKSNSKENEGEVGEMVPKINIISEDMLLAEDKETKQDEDMCMSDPIGGTFDIYNIETDDISMADAKLSDEGSKINDNNYESIVPTCVKSLDIRNESESVDSQEVQAQTFDGSDIFIKIVLLRKRYLLPKNMAYYVQRLISLNILQVYNKELPLLQCHGIKNGALVYSCHDKKSYECLLKICVGNNIILFAKEFDKMSMKINRFFEFDDDYIFNMLEMYNNKISTKKWRILKKNVLDDFVIYDVKMDKKSFKFIMNSNMALFAGVDKVTFSIIWE